MKRLEQGPGFILLVLALLALRLAAYALLAEPGPGGDFAKPLCHFDCVWYTQIAHTGYDLTVRPARHHLGQANWAFFPVYPMLVHVAAAAGRISYPAAALAVSNLCFAGFILLAATYLARLSPASRAGLALFLVTFPFGLYFTLGYTESLFALLCMAAFLLSERRDPLGPALACGVLCATRVTGILFAPILLARLLREKQGKKTWLGTAWSLLLSGAGLLLYMAYLAHHMGDPLAFLHIQSAWGRGHFFPLWVLLRPLVTRHPVWPLLHDHPSPQFCSLCALAGLAMATYLAWRRRYGEAWFLGATILLALSSSIISLPRYVFANPVFLVFAYDLLWRHARPWLPAILLGGTALQLYLVHLWVLSYAALI